jgi:hypothetical protein
VAVEKEVDCWVPTLDPLLHCGTVDIAEASGCGRKHNNLLSTVMPFRTGPMVL